MALKVGELYASFGIDSKQLDSAMKSIESTCNKIAGDLAKTGAVLSLAVTAPLVKVGKDMLQASIDYESAFAGVRKTVDITSGDIEAGYKRISDALLEMSQNMPQDYITLSGIAENAGQLGVAEEHIVSFTKVIADLVVATNLSEESAAGMIAQYANITGMDLANVDRLGSTIVALGNNTATTEADIVEMMHGLAGAGKIVGLTDAQIAGLAATLSSLGINAEAGGSAMSRTLSLMESAVIAGGDDLKDFAKVSGLTSAEFAKQWQTDPMAALQTFSNGLQKIKDDGGDVDAALESVGINSVVMKDMWKRLMGSGNLLTDTVLLANDAFIENTALIEEAEKRYGTLDSKIKMAQNAYTNMLAAFGNVAIENSSLGGIVDTVKNLFISLAGADDATKQLIINAGLIAAAAGPVLVNLGGVVALVGKLGPLLASMMSPMGVVAVGLGLMAVAAIDADNRIGKGFESIAKKAKANLPAVNKTIRDTVSDIGKRLPELIGSITAGIEDLVPSIVSVVSTAVSSLLDVLGDNASGLLDIGVTLIESLIEGITQSMPQIMKSAVNFMANFAVGLIDSIPRLLECIDDIAIAIGEGLTSIDWLDLGSKIIDAIGEALSKIIDIFGEWFERGKEAVSTIDWVSVGISILEAIKSAVVTIADWLGKLFTQATEWVNDTDWASLGQLIWEGIKKFAIAVGEWFAPMIENAKKWVTDNNISWQSVGEAIGDAITSVVLVVEDWLDNILGDATEWVNDTDWASLGQLIWDGIVSFVGSAVDFVANLFNNIKNSSEDGENKSILESIGGFIWSTIRAAILVVGEIGKNLLEAIWKSIKDSWEWFKGEVSGMFTGLWDSIVGIFGGGDNKEVTDGTQGIVDAADTVMATLPEQTKGHGSRSIAHLVDSLDTGKADVETSSAAIIEAIDEQVKTLPDMTVEYSEEAMEGMEDAIDSHKGLIATASENVSSEAVAKFVQHLNYQGGAEIGKLFAWGLAVGINAGAVLVYQASRSVSQTAESLASSTLSNGSGFRLGYNFSVGIASGILSGISLIVQAANEAALAAVHSVKSTLKINSPSGVGRFLGKMFDKGGAIGVIENVPLLENAGQIAGKALAESFYINDPSHGVYNANKTVYERNAGTLDNNLQENSTQGASAREIGSAIADRLIERNVFDNDVYLDGKKVGENVSGTVSKTINKRTSDGWVGRSAKVVLGI
ncbi:MAG: phage tail tape measure protein [Actinomycetaceae bacterium]|nr:phage tail tape measure protein [Actinomycetaceae bacterium]